MSTKMAIWRVEREKVQRLSLGGIDFEKHLERIIDEDPSILDLDLMIVGRQVPTPYGGHIDLLAIDAAGDLTVIELKRDRTPRDVVAQVLDYGSAVKEMTPEIAPVFVEYQRRFHGVEQPEAIDTAFQRRFGGRLDELNSAHRLLIIGAEVDSATERIVRYLREEHEIDINVVLFRAFQDGDRQYLARSWMSEPEASPLPATRGEWNEEYYANFDEGGSRLWDDAREYGFICAGGGEWYVRTLGLLEPGARVWVSVPGRGYVGVGRVVTPVAHYEQFTLKIDGSDTPITKVGLKAENAFNEDDAQHFVGIDWIKTVDLQHAVRERGFFGNQNTVARPRSPKWDYTVERLKSLWGVK